MNIKTFDLNLLRVFAAIYAERNVSRAATATDLTQPAVSNALSRLRLSCGDVLFVRTSQGMEPTAMANAMIVPVREALGVLQDYMDRPTGFVASTSERVFRLLTSDAGESAVVPPLLAVLRREAPNVNIEALRLPYEQYAPSLQSGTADLALGNLPFLKAGFYQQWIFADPYCCVARRRHPSVKGSLSLAQFLAAHHVATETGNADVLVERALSAKRARRTIKLKVTHYHVAADIVAETDLIATLPVNVALRTKGLQVLALPINVPAAQVRQFWHRRAHKDPAHEWFRALLSSLGIVIPDVTADAKAKAGRL